jgi:phenylacetate-coenzyme A ligase PaaK-like adenylate-forming protein
MATVTTLTKFSNVAEANAFSGQGVLAYTQAYAATDAWVAKDAMLQHVCYAQLTGAMTINATVTALEQFSEVIFHFGTDGTQRIVTFGTNFKSSGTVTIPASKGAVVRAIFNGTDLCVVSREIWA